MIKRAKQVYNKFIFCLRVAGNARSFFQLIANSKRFNRFQKHYSAGDAPHIEAVSYNIVLGKYTGHLYLRTYAGDIRMFYELLLEKMYRLPHSFLPANAVIVDAGANIGMAALYFASAYPDATIYCIEPAQGNFNLLKKNLQNQIAANKVQPLQAALYKEDGMVSIDESGWAYNARLRPEGKTSVQAICMITFMKNNKLQKIDLLKMDIEGAEAFVFSGDLSWLQQVSAILIEIHSPDLVTSLRSLLQAAGFYWYDWSCKYDPGTVFLASKIAISRT
jgi:FkbM family methyltransferase